MLINKHNKNRETLYRHICMIADAAMLVVVGLFVVYLFMRDASTHYDVDRSVFPVKGIDISAHNGRVDFARVAADSVSFVMLKATEGTDFCDASFVDNYRKARDAGLKVGAYHFFRFDTPGDVQAVHFLATLDSLTFELPLAIDVEEWGNPPDVDDADIKANLRLMLRYMAARGYPMMIYTNKKGLAEFVEGDFDDVPLWICSLSGVPQLQGWIIWQHSHRGLVDGVPQPVDLNTYNGSALDFDSSIIPFTVIAQ